MNSEVGTLYTIGYKSCNDSKGSLITVNVTTYIPFTPTLFVDLAYSVNLKCLEVSAKLGNGVEAMFKVLVRRGSAQGQEY